MKKKPFDDPEDVGSQGEQGEQGEAGADGSDAAVLRVFDANGDDVGIFAGQQDMFILWVYLQEFEALAPIEVLKGGLGEADFTEFYWESTNCSGLAYSTFPARVLNVPHSAHLVTDTETVVVTVQSKSDDPVPSPSDCQPESLVLNLSPVTIIDPIVFPAPLYVAPAPAPAP